MDPARDASNRSRQNSAAATPIPPQDAKPSKPNTQSIPAPHYTVFIRLPFPRNDFQDPPLVEWDSSKDKALWKLISTASNSKELDWEGMSTKFNVSLPFLLQQAAWLYERHFEGMRAQMKRLGASSAAASGAPSPAPDGGVRVDGGASLGGVAMQRTGSKDSSRAPPSINTMRNSPLPHGDIGSTPSTPRSTKPVISRSPSTATVTQSRVFSSPRQGFRASSGTLGKNPPAAKTSYGEDDDPVLGRDGVSEAESESDEEPSNMSRSQAFRRPPFNKKPTTATLSSDADGEDDDDDSSGGNLPFAAPSKSAKDDPAATLRSSPKRQGAIPQNTINKGKAKEQPTRAHDSSASSTSSAQPAPATTNATDQSNRPGPLSPRYRAELEKLSPRHKKSGSEGSPSMGSSFSDLDDTSVTQSALEDALMSNMQHGSIGMGSRMSTLRDALGRK